MTTVTVTFKFDNLSPKVLDEALRNWRDSGLLRDDLIGAIDGVFTEDTVVEYDDDPEIEIGDAEAEGG